jgi:hypothetical protein
MDHIGTNTRVFDIRVTSTLPPRWVVDAYLGALDRVRAADNSGAPESMTIALVEALMWIDVLRARGRTVGRGRDLSEALAAHPVIRGLAFLRGRVHHQWGTVVSQGHSSGQWVWTRAEFLPEPPTRFRDPDGEALYREHLQARPVIDALGEVAALLADIERP